jgi:DNA-binding NarL/FixJ family response regulator
MLNADEPRERDMSDMTYEEQIATMDRPKLVVADDDAFMCMMLSSQLAHDFDCVATASDSDGAVEAVRTHRPDVAILDVVMPGGGAVATTRAIRECSPDTAIVILSGDELDSEVVALLNAGASGYLRKGIEPADLARSLSVAIAAHASASARAAATRSNHEAATR